MIPRLVLDTNVLITAAMNPGGPSGQILQLANRGAVEVVMSEHLLDELDTRLQREKFRRWLSLDEVEVFVDTVAVLGQWVGDRPEVEIASVCDDPDDNFLVALFQDADAQMLVSGDKAVLRIDYPNVFVYKPAAALEALQLGHAWGDEFTTGSRLETLRDIAAEGNGGIVNAYSAFAHIIQHRELLGLLPRVVVPDTVRAFRKSAASIASDLARRGMASRPIYASVEIAYIKLPPDPEIPLRAFGDVALPTDTIFATMQRCPDLTDSVGFDFDHWRVWGIGSTVAPEHIRPRPPVR